MLKKTVIVFFCVLFLVPVLAVTASAEILSGSGYMTEGDKPLTIGTGTVFAQYVNNSTYYMLHDIPAVPPQDKITTKGLIGSYVPSNCTFFNLGFETDMENVFFAFSNQNPIKPGDVITFSCKVDCIFNDYTDDKQNLNSLNAFNFIIRFFYEDDFYERIEVRTAVEKVNGVALCTLTFKNTTGRNLSLYNLKVAGAFDAGSYTGCNFRLYDLRYHLYSDSELATIEEKKDSNSQGNASVDALESVIPNDSEGFINGMSSLISAVSYEGTDAKWQFPALYIPEIPGVIGRTQLTEKELDIDFGYWVERIPSNILQIIRIVLTVALIVFCFKELYGTISYVLTLKKDGGGE